MNGVHQSMIDHDWIRKKIPCLIGAAMAMILASFMLSQIFWSHKRLFFCSFIVLGGSIIIYCLHRNDFLRKFDTFLFSLFIAFSLISTLLGGRGFLDFFLSGFMAIWLMILASYYIVQEGSDGSKFIRVSFFISSLILSMHSIFSLIYASVSLFDGNKKLDLIKGCFIRGRFYAIGNANYMGFSCGALIIMSIFGFIVNARRRGIKRTFYAITGLVGWFCLGLTGCRTAAVGISFAIGLFAFFYLINKISGIKIIKRVLLSLIISGLIFTGVLTSLYLPSFIYRESMTIIGSAFLGKDALKSLLEINAHRISEDDGTMTGRTLIWVAGIKDCLKNPRRLLFGISPLSTEGIYTAYPGHHEIRSAHAHNVYIEILRENGIFGYVTIVALIIGWAINGMKVILSKETDRAELFLVAAFFAMLIMGMAEPMPFADSQKSFLTITFFMTCGYITALGRKTS